MYARSRASRTRAANPAALFLGLSLRALALALALALAMTTAGAPHADSMDTTSAEDILCTTTVAPISAPGVRPASLDDPVLAPADVTSAGGRARQLTSSSWHVPQHRALEAFLYVSGPSVITRYTFQFVARLIKTQFVRRQPFLGGDKYSPADTYVLTEVGESRRETHPDTMQLRASDGIHL